jgi:methionine--tRNA ligase beta chain
MLINLADFSKLAIRIGQVQSAKQIEGTDRLLLLEIDFGSEQRQIVTGMALFYSPAHLIGKQVPVLVNLAPREICGVESQGMLLSANNSGKPILLLPEEEVKLGSLIH